MWRLRKVRKEKENRYASNQIQSCLKVVCSDNAAALWVGTDDTLLSNPLPAKSSPVIPAGGSPLQGNTAGGAGGSPWFVSVIFMITDDASALILWRYGGGAFTLFLGLTECVTLFSSFGHGPACSDRSGSLMVPGLFRTPCCVVTLSSSTVLLSWVQLTYMLPLCQPIVVRSPSMEKLWI